MQAMSRRITATLRLPLLLLAVPLIATLRSGLSLARILTVQHELATGLGDHVLDERARKQQATRVTQGAAGCGHDLDARFGGITKTHLGKQPQRRLMDLINARLRQRLETAALHTGSHRPQMLRQGT